MKDETSEKAGMSRRDFLGRASIGAVILSSVATMTGALRLTKANVHYEESKVFKIGAPDNFPVGTVKLVEGKNVFIFSDSDGLHAISNVCTHLGCLVSASEDGFLCPCHGSKYNRDGKVVAGPAPRSLPWLDITQQVDGILLVDASKEIKAGTKFKVQLNQKERS